MHQRKSGFPIMVLLVGEIEDKMVKNYMKITKLTFLRQNDGGGNGRDKPVKFFR